MGHWVEKFHIHMCLMKSKAYKRMEDTQDELLARVLDSAASIKKREDQPRRSTRDHGTRVDKCTDTGGGTVELLF
jgi:hypothetical protein